jgi:hypothetical protein
MARLHGTRPVTAALPAGRPVRPAPTGALLGGMRAGGTAYGTPDDAGRRGKAPAANTSRRRPGFVVLKHAGDRPPGAAEGPDGG